MSASRYTSKPERPLADVLARAIPGEFAPEHPNRRPWFRTRLGRVEPASTGNVAVVNLAVTDRMQLHGLGRPSWQQDWLEPFDWMPAGWSVGPTSGLDVR